MAMIAAAEATVMLVVQMLLFGEGGIGEVGDETAAVVGEVVLVVLVLFSSETSASCDDYWRRSHTAEDAVMLVVLVIFSPSRWRHRLRAMIAATEGAAMFVVLALLLAEGGDIG